MEPSGCTETREVVENFHGVYLLVSKNPRCSGRTYIGYTVNPGRRINQHNRGKEFGGAKRTDNRGPWDMVLIVHGFPSDISALRFEWNWQHYDRSRFLRGVLVPCKKTTKENRFGFCLRVMAAMLRIAPWNRLPLTLRWLIPEYATSFPAGSPPPPHMPICEGLVVPRKVGPSLDSNAQPHSICPLCSASSQSQESLACLHCKTASHTRCLADHFLGGSSYLLPISGNCPNCSCELLWGDLIRAKNGCYRSEIQIASDSNCFS